MTNARPIRVAGAGSIGCFVGGVLADAGHDVALLARSRLIGEMQAHGLRLTSVDGYDRCLDGTQLPMSDDPAILSDAGIVLVTVKSGDTAAMAALIAQHAPTDAVIVSLQNGVGNVDVLRQRLPGHHVLGGMVPFNVVAKAPGHVHRATSGDVIVGRDEAGTAAALSVRHLTVRASDDIAGVQWGKLLVNLNNALNALSGAPLREQLLQRAWRRLFADQMTEALAVLKAAGIRPLSATPIPVQLTPYLLRLPDPLFRVLLDRVMKVDADARSSMWEDLQYGRRTEVDYLQGVIVQLAARHGRRAPLVQRVMELIKAAELSETPPAFTPLQIRSR